VEGPHLLRVQVCGIDFIHPFYSLHSPTPPVAGYDFILAAKLIIDTVGQSVYSGWNTSLRVTVTPLPQMSSIVQQPVDVSRYTPIMNPGCVPAASLTNQFYPASMMSESFTSQPVHGNTTLPTHTHCDVPVVCEPSNTQLLPQLLPPVGIVTSVPQLSSSAPGTVSACPPQHFQPCAMPPSQDPTVRPCFYSAPPHLGNSAYLSHEDTNCHPADGPVLLNPCAAPFSLPTYSCPPAAQYLPSSITPPQPSGLHVPQHTTLEHNMGDRLSFSLGHNSSGMGPSAHIPLPSAPSHLSATAHHFPTDEPDQTLAPAHVTPSGIINPHMSNITIDNDITHLKTPESSNQSVPEHLRVLFLQTVEENHLSSDVAAELKDLLIQHEQTFAKDSTDFGYCPIVEHDIDTGEARPIKQSPRRPPLAAREAEDEILNDMLKTGVIEPSNSPWASPVCLVKKKDGSYRFCIDYRKVNAVSKRDAFPVPDIHDALDSLRGARYFATLDLLSGYWQLGMTERAKQRSAFCTRRGLFHFTRMPFGLAGAPASFCRLMNTALSDLLWVICLCYLDDIIIYARTQRELLQRLNAVLNRLREVGLKIKPSKCALFKTQIQFLGHLVSYDGVEPLPDKLQAIVDWPTPHCLRDVRAFYGLASYYRRFVKNFATIAEPLTRLTRKGCTFVWADEAQEAFLRLKSALVDAATLAFPQPDLPCILDSDASDVAIGAVLSQVINGEERPIAFFSRVLNPAQRNYCPTRRELLAVVAALQHFRHYLLGNQVVLRTDHHSLKWLNTFKRPEGIMARWIETLAEYDYTIEHRPGRLHCNADSVSRPLCKQCWGKQSKIPWVDELEAADEITEPLSVRTVTFSPSISDPEMTKLQADDATLGPVILALTHGSDLTVDELRSLPLDSRNLYSQRPMVHLLNGVLVRQDGTTTQLVVPTSLRKQLFNHIHSGPLSAHLATERTLAQLRQLYYWPGMKRDVTDWHMQCHQCAQSRGPPSRPHGKLTKVLTGAPLDIVAIDVLSGLPSSSDGSKYLLVVTDYFTKWCEAYPLPDAEASTCMQALYNGFFSRFGFPRQLHSDQGKNFESKLFSEICKLTGITKTRTTPFHPRSDGQTERMNRTILQMLRACIHDNPSSWPDRITAILSAYRMTIHKTTGLTPNKAMLGREVLLPVALLAKPPDEPVEITTSFAHTFRDNMRQAHEQIRHSTSSVAKTQKTYFDRHVKGLHFGLGQLVWLYWPRPPQRHMYRKLQWLWTGPWRITKFISNIVVQIQHVYNHKRQTVHVDRLVLCHIQHPPPSAITASHTPEHIPDSSTPAIAAQHQVYTTPPPTILPARQRRRPAHLRDYII